MQGFLLYKEQLRQLRLKKNPRLLLEKELKKPWFQREMSLRRRYLADRRVITCVVLSGLLLSGLGSGLTALGYTVLAAPNPLRLIGPVVISCGVMVLLLSIEVCIRRKRILRRIGGEDEDELKRHIDPDLLNYGGIRSTEREPRRITLAAKSDQFGSEEDGLDAVGATISAGPTEMSGRSQSRAVVPSTSSLTESPQVNVTPPTPTDAESHPPLTERVELLLSPGRLKDKR